MKKILLLATTIFCFLNLINAQAGQPDPSFGTNGIVKTDLGKNYNYANSGRKVLTQADGSSYLVLQTNNQALITKRHPNGSTDSSYGQNGFSDNVQMEHTSAAVLQSDGKILVGGSNDKPFAYYSALARFNADGSLDSSFSNDGVMNDFSTSTYSPDIIVTLSNEKIVVGFGRTFTRFNSNGNLDSTLNGNGRQFTGDDNEINGIAIQKDGKIVVAGYSYFSSEDTSFYFVARYNTDGSPDETFGNAGQQKTALASAGEYPNSVLIQSDGKIVVGGTALIRYNTDGSLDSSFSKDGILTTNFTVGLEQVYSLALQADGKIVVAGNTQNNGKISFTIARYNNNGSIDKTFVGDGTVTNTFKIASAAIQKDGKIIVAGSENFDFALARYTANGAPDNTFSKDGKLTGSVHSGYTVYKSTAIQKDGKIVAAGRTWNGNDFDFAIARYNTDGSLDKAFSSDGVQITDFISKNDYANSVAIQNDGKIVVVGYTVTGNNDSSLFSVARYNTDGSLDNTFSIDGKRQTNFGSATNEANSAAIQNDGKIVVVGKAAIEDTSGNYNSNFAIARYNADGSPDKTFDEDGKQSIVSEYTSYASSVVIQSNGKIVVGGHNYNRIRIARFNTNGSLDYTFGNGKNDDDSNDDISPGDDFYMSLALQNDEKIVVGGYSFYRGKNENFVGRITADGKFDSTFSFQRTSLAEASTYPRDFGNSAAIQNDGKIVVASGAAFTRYSANGSLDSTFGVDGIQATPETERKEFINSIAISGNKLYGVGYSNSPGNVGLAARYLLDNSNTPPSVILTTPAGNTTRLAPAAHIKLSAAAADKDGTITKVEFYNGTTLLHTETVIPYGFVWRNVPLGNYTITAKAYDNSGLVTTSAPVHISVVPNKPPVVSITKPASNQSFAAPGYIHLEAAASDTDGRITNVKFYSDTILLRTEYEFPYTYNWENVPTGTYTVTAVATDNWGAHTTSAPVTIRVKSANTMMVSSKPADNKTVTSDAMILKLFPNPATDVVNIYTHGLLQSKPATISIISVSGIVLKKVQTGSAAQIQLDVSSLAKGVYTVKIVSGEKVMLKQFVKL